MAYIITIEVEETVEIRENPERQIYKKIHDRLPSDENWSQIKEYDWIPNPNQEPKITESKRTTGIYTQTVDELDIAAVIIAVNKLKETK